MKLEISATSTDYPAWAAPVHVYFRRLNGGWRLVGIDRRPELEAGPEAAS